MGWVNGEVDSLHWWNDRLFSLRVRAAVDPFCAGQFNRIRLPEGDGTVGRPYSYVNAPDDPLLDFFVVVVPGGALSPRLAALRPGDSVELMPKASGFFTLDELPDADDLWLLATGTALGPFLSILRTAAPWQRFRRVTLVHAVRHPEDQAYADVITAIGAAHPETFRFVPVLSRADRPGALRGRIPTLLASGELERSVGAVITPEHSQCMLCGNPQMVVDTQNELKARGLTRNRRRTPGQITVENYW